MLQAHLYSLYTSSRVRHFTKDHWFHLLVNTIRNRDLGAGCARCSRTCHCRPSQWTELGDLGVHQPMCVQVLRPDMFT